MSSPNGSPAQGADDAGGHPGRVDGRHARSAASRSRIVDAMIALVAEGTPSPTAEAVAARAGVSLRTVFRHFNEMEQLHAAIGERIAASLGTYQGLPPASGTWEQRVPVMVARRAPIYERLLPFKAAMEFRRHESPTIAVQHQRIHAEHRAILDAALPDTLTVNPVRRALVEHLLGIDCWASLRTTQNLTIEQASEVIIEGLRALDPDQA